MKVGPWGLAVSVEAGSSVVNALTLISVQFAISDPPPFLMFVCSLRRFRLLIPLTLFPAPLLRGWMDGLALPPGAAGWV